MKKDENGNARRLSGVASVYFGNNIGAWKRFLLICRREGTTASKKIVSIVIDYVQEHDPGNPQTNLISYSEGGAITVAQIEGQVRQFFYNRDYPDIVSYPEVVNKVKSLKVKGREIVNMSKRIMDWLKGQGKKVSW